MEPCGQQAKRNVEMSRNTINTRAHTCTHRYTRIICYMCASNPLCFGSFARLLPMVVDNVSIGMIPISTSYYKMSLISDVVQPQKPLERVQNRVNIIDVLQSSHQIERSATHTPSTHQAHSQMSICMPSPRHVRDAYQCPQMAS